MSGGWFGGGKQQAQIMEEFVRGVVHTHAAHFKHLQLSYSTAESIISFRNAKEGGRMVWIYGTSRKVNMKSSMFVMENRGNGVTVMVALSVWCADIRASKMFILRSIYQTLWQPLKTEGEHSL